MQVLLADPAGFALVAGFFGLLIGSFLNVVIHRLPLMLEREWAGQCAELRGEPAPAGEPFSLVRPRSRCPSCGTGIAPWDNLPVVSWLLLRGRCRACKAPISARYPAVEAITGALFAWSAWHFGFGLQAALGLVFTAYLIALTGIDLDDYSGSTMGNLPIGQGISVTPMQMAAAYSAIANGGILRTPRLIAQVGGEQRAKDTTGERVISAQTASQIRTMLEGVLAPGGTASEVEVPGYQLAGKTGTAEKAVDGGYSETDYVASFVGFAPASRPKLLVAVMVDTPQYETSGGAVAAPVFGQIAEFALPYLGISPG